MRAAAVLVLAALCALRAAPAAAQPGLVAAAPELDEATGELVLYVAGRADDESPAVVTEPQLYIDGEGPLSPAGRDKVVDYAADHTKWTPPFAVGLVYLWCKGAPPAIVEGIEALFRHVPGRTAVYPTPYGQGHRQVVTKLTASRMAGGDVADYQQIPGDQLKLEDAVRFNVSKLIEDRSPIKILIIITDGRGPATGKDYGPFRKLAEDLRRSGLQVIVLGLTAPVDVAESAANVYELADTAHARLIRVDRGSDVVAMIESLAEPLSSYERMRFELPWLTARLGGEHRLQLRGTVRGGSARAAGVTVGLPRQITNLLLLLAAAVLVVVGAAIALLRKRRPHPAPAPRSYGHGHVPGQPPQPAQPPIVRRDPGPPPKRSNIPMTLARGSREAASVPVRRETPSPVVAPPFVPVPAPYVPPPQPRREPPPPLARPEAPFELRPDDVTAVAEVLRLGVSPARAVLAVARRLGGRTDDVLGDPRMASDGDPAVAGRAGQSRLREMRRLVASHSPRDTFVREVGPILCGALRDQTNAREGARRLRARMPVEAWTSLLRLGAEALEQAISAAATALPDLGVAAARSYVRDVQRELARGPVAPLVVWLVRVAGPGAAGQSIDIRRTTTVGGPGSPTVIAEDDPQLLPNLAEIMVDGNDAILTPFSGPVELDGEDALAGSLLADAQTLGLGACLYVVRLVRRDVNLAGPTWAAPAPTQR